MKKIDFENIKKVHFIGIGGISMSGLAETLNKKGVKVSGSDTKESYLTQQLRKKGIEVFLGQRQENIRKDVDIVVYTAAVKEDNPEILKAKALEINIVDRAFLMGELMKKFDKSICISGTHGKTTTTSIISEIFMAAGKDPTINLGGVLPSINSNYLVGESGYFIAESCEYFDSFLKFYPYIGIVLNIEADHLDYFENLEQIENSFKAFVQNIKDKGVLVINYNIECKDKITKDLKCEVITYGDEKAHWHGKNIIFDKNGFGSFDIIGFGRNMGRVELNVRGEHNILNAVGAIAVAYWEGIDIETIKQGLLNFRGTKRRYEYKGLVNGVTIVDDYAHHPTEIKATIAAAKNTVHNKLYCVYQPHTYTRTIKLFDEIVESFNMADVVIFVDIYSAREPFTNEVHSKQLAEKSLECGKEAYYFSSFDEAKKFLLQKCIHGDLLITMGAGDVYILGENML